VGEGPTWKACRTRASRLRSAQRLVLAGLRQDLAAVYNALDMLVIPSRSEGMTTVLLDAMLMGVPVVSTRVGTVPQIVRDGETALLVPIDDTQALADAIARLAADKPLRRRLADLGPGFRAGPPDRGGARRGDPRSLPLPHRVPPTARSGLAGDRIGGARRLALQPRNVLKTISIRVKRPVPSPAFRARSVLIESPQACLVKRMAMLDSNRIESYRRDGFLSGIRVMTDSEIRQYRDGFDALEAREGCQKSANQLADPHFDHRFVWDIATHPDILDCVTALIGPNVFLLSSHFFCKHGPDDKFVAWHQDLRYWGLEPPVAVSAWYAVDDSDVENGCMRVVPGFNRDRLLEHGKSGQEGNLLTINQEVEVDEQDEERAVNCVLKAGEISLHGGTVVHGSLPNRSTRRRCGLAIPYIPTHLKPTAPGPIGTDLKWRPILVRGVDREKHFEPVQCPFPMRGEP